MEIEGAWIRVCCKLWWSETPGSLTKTLEQWAKILRENRKKTEKILNYFTHNHIGDLVNQNGEITITSRRMIRDEYIRKIRKEAGIKGGNPALKKSIDLLNQIPTTPPSKNQPLHLQSSSSSSKEKKNIKEKKTFTTPSIEEVSAYCQERGRGVNPEKWIAHYQSNGWRIGKNPMKDWKAAVITWEPDSNPKQKEVDLERERVRNALRNQKPVDGV